jgi:hypothetical protein
MGVQRNPNGPLITTSLRSINEVIFWAPTRPPEIEPRDDDQVYMVRSFDRLDNIAAQELNNSQLGWVILLRNDLRLVPNDLIPGRTIFIPTRQSLRDRGVVE